MVVSFQKYADERKSVQLIAHKKIEADAQRQIHLEVFLTNLLNELRAA